MDAPFGGLQACTFRPFIPRSDIFKLVTITSVSFLILFQCGYFLFKNYFILFILFYFIFYLSLLDLSFHFGLLRKITISSSTTITITNTKKKGESIVKKNLKTITSFRPAFGAIASRTFSFFFFFFFPLS
jgi:hypothetical protein